MKHIIDFEIYTRGNPETLILLDTSELYEFPANQIVEVQFPNFESVYSDYYNVDKPTVLTTKSLGYTPERIQFPDGLYFIRVSVTPNDTVYKCKHYMKLDKAESLLASKLEGCITDKEILELMELDKFITAAKLAADVDPQKSIDLFNLITKKLNKLNCENNGL